MSSSALPSSNEELREVKPGRKETPAQVTGVSIGVRSENRKTAQDYALAVSEFSAKSRHISLHPGVSYRSLALFLNPHNILRPPLSQFRPQSFVFAALHDLAFGFDDARRVTLFDNTADIQKLAEYPYPSRNGGQLLFVRGYPGRDWLNIIGARYRIDPEFFRRYLTLGYSRDFYDLPALPSAAQNIVNLNITSIGRRELTTLGRRDGLEILQAHFQSLGRDPSILGDSIVRRFSAHDDEHFSIEQNISICVVTRDGGWIAIVLLDNGRDLNEGPRGPWFSTVSRAQGFDDIFLPIIQLEPKICLRQPGKKKAANNINESTEMLPKSRSSQSASLLHTNLYGQFLSPSLMHIDAFYALHELFNFSLSSESQFLNLLKSKLDIEAQRLDEEFMQPSLLILKYHKQILNDHIRQLRETHSIIQQRGSVKWPRAKSLLSDVAPTTRHVPQDPPTAKSVATTALEEESERAHCCLLNDCAALLCRAESLSRAYGDCIDDIRNTALLMESRKAIDQAQAVARLTLLAFFFIPLGFTTSFFGMNFKELGDKLSIWVWFAMTTPVFCSALAFCFWNHTWAFGRRVWKYLYNVIGAREI